MRFPFSKPLDPVISPYVKGTARRVSRSTPLREIPFLVLDAETTGFNLLSDRILSIAAIPVRGDRAEIGGMRNWLVYHPDAHVTAATKIHTILPSESSLGMPMPEILTDLSHLLTGAVVVGHHIHFDAAMIDREMRRIFRTGLRNPLVDTASMAMRSVEAFRKSGYSNQRPPSLDELCTHLGLPLWERHTADGDSFATAQLFLMLCARLRQKLGREVLVGDLPLTRA